MSDSEVDVAADRVAAAFTCAVDGLLTVALTSVPRLGLVEPTGRIETQLRRMTSFDHALVTALVDSDARFDVGARNTGGPMEPQFEQVAAAQADGAISAAHARPVLDPDGTLSSDEDHHRRRGFTLSPRSDGSADVRGRLTPQCAAIVLAALDPSPHPDPPPPPVRPPVVALLMRAPRAMTP